MVVCPRCGGEVALHEGEPLVSNDGAVELWHPSCRSNRQLLVAGENPMFAHPRTKRRRIPWVITASMIAIAAIAIPSWTRAAAPLPDEVANLDLPIEEPASLQFASTTNEDPLPARALEALYPVPAVDDVPLDETYPSLREWTYPVVDSSERLPEEHCRLFGADRTAAGIAVPRPDCGEGHCGIDLDGPRGRAVVAVADGVVVRVEHSELGLDGRSGRYVRIQHDDSTLTAYMHLDDIVQGLEVGDRVRAGQQLGTLGATATYQAPAHLHFSLEIPNELGTFGDITDTHYVDPAPFLVRGMVIATGDRRHATKPAM